jgi:hypothetical protein
MDQQATALIKFKHCDFSEHYAEAASVYDAAESTAWIAPFTMAQKDYWARQPSIYAPQWLTVSLLNYGITYASLSGRAFNQYADDLAAKRNTAIYDSAKSAFDACMAGGASTPAAQETEPGFRLAVQTRLEGGSVSVGASSSDGLSAQINVPFTPSNPANAADTLDWKPFYRLGPISWAVCSPALWTMELWWNFYSNYPIQLRTPSSGLIVISLPWFTTISADTVQYISAPEGYILQDPGSLNANFSALVSSLDFVVTRHVYLPDGAHLVHSVHYSGGVTVGGIDSKTVYLDFEVPINADIQESGWVEIYYVIELYTIGTVYELNSDIEQIVDMNGVVRPRRVVAGAEEYMGSSSYPPTGFNRVMESYYFLKLNLGAVVITTAAPAPIVYLFHIGDRPVINSNISLVFSRDYYLDNVFSYLPVSTYGPAELSFPLNVFWGGVGNSIMLDIPIVERVSLVYVAPDPDEGVIGGHFLESAPTAHVFNSPSSDPFKIQVTGHDLLIRVTSMSNTSAPGGMIPLPDFRIL